MGAYMEKSGKRGYYLAALFEPFLDSSNNMVQLQCGEEVDVSIHFIGEGSKIEIGKGCFLSREAYIHMENGGRLILEDGVEIHSQVHICVCSGQVILRKGTIVERGTEIHAEGKDASIKCEEHVHIGYNGKIRAYGMGEIDLGKYVVIGENGYMVSGGNVKVGNSTSFAHDLELRATPETYVNIGRNCLFSYCVRLRSSDGHAIFEDGTKNVLSHNQNVGIEIDEHVWIGMNVTVLYHSVIGKNCVIGADSFVKESIPQGCECVGNPLRIIRRDINWSVTV